MAFEFNPFTGSLDSVGLSQASADARYVLKVAGSFSGLTGAGFRDTSAAFDVTLGFTSSAALTAARALTLDVVNASRSIKLAGNVDLGGNFTTTGSGTLALGGFTLTVPATGTAALLGTANVFTAAQTISVAGANSTSPLYLTGALNVAGTGTTTFPQIFHQPIGTTAATTWSSGANGGTVFGANETTGFVGNFADFRLAGVIRAVISYDGRIKGIYNPGYPQFTAAGLETSGMRVYSDRVDFWQAGSVPLTIQGDAINLGNATTINWNSGATLRSKAAAALQLGGDAAGVTNQMLTAASRITSDGVGANLTIAGGNGRGGAGGSLILATYDTQGAGTIGVLRTRLIIDTAGLSTFNSSVTVGAGNLTLSDAVNVVLGETTGTKIGTAATQKLGFWNMTPIVQPDTSVTPATFASHSGTNVYDASTWDGYSIGHIVAALRNIGILA